MIIPKEQFTAARHEARVVPGCAHGKILNEHYISSKIDRKEPRALTLNG